MSEITESYIAGLLAAGTVVAALGRYWGWPGSRRRDMPPEPSSFPLLGNPLELKLVNIFAQFCELNEDHGPLATLKLGSGDGTLVRELLDERGVIYSIRSLEMTSFSKTRINGVPQESK
ncbi:hypothetical protein B0J17DRAFT_626249 [Rhizoctonia solani]|nr:hypothetical protein B0J17DRAFT_626249 [Rhizoctonia solani]